MKLWIYAKDLSEAVVEVTPSVLAMIRADPLLEVLGVDE